MQKSLKLNNGMEIPVVGLGTYLSERDKVVQAVGDAIDAGYRHFDCAWFYGNQGEVIDAINAKIEDGEVKRDDLFITSRLWNHYHRKDAIVSTLKEELSYINLEYVDLYHMQWPFVYKQSEDQGPVFEGGPTDIDYLDTWEGMEECLNLGLTKSIGVSNFNIEQIDRLLKNCKIKPVCNQVEVTPNYNQKELIEFCKQHDIIVVGYSPLGRNKNAGIPGFPEPTIFDPKVAEIAEKHNKTPAQVVLNYLISLGICVIPKSVTKSRIIENINIFDFTLYPVDVDYLDSCNKNQMVCPLSMMKEGKYLVDYYLYKH